MKSRERTDSRQSSRIGERFAQVVSRWTGSTIVFSAALVSILLWAVLGPFFQYSDSWQLVMNTASSIVTFLMVFLIQRSQNKDSLAIHIKLNEIVVAIEGASNRIVNVEELSEEELDRLRQRYQDLAARVSRLGDSRRAVVIPHTAEKPSGPLEG